MPQLVTITGATGNIGRVLTGRLIQNGVKVRAVSRNAGKLKSLTGAEVCAGDITDTNFLNEVFRGSDAVFAMIPEHVGASDFLGDKRKSAASLAEAIRKSGVPRVVALSAIGVTPPSGIGPAAANGEFEDMLKSIPSISVVALRPAFLMENHLASIPLIKNAGINGSPVHADVAISMIATRDIAEAAAEYLTEPNFEGCTVRELLGPRDYTFREATSILGATIDKPELPYVEFSFDDFRGALMGAGLSASTADAIIELNHAFNDGKVQSLATRTPENTTSTTLEIFARDIFAPAYVHA